MAYPLIGRRSSVLSYPCGKPNIIYQRIEHLRTFTFAILFCPTCVSYSHAELAYHTMHFWVNLYPLIKLNLPSTYQAVQHRFIHCSFFLMCNNVFVKSYSFYFSSISQYNAMTYNMLFVMGCILKYEAYIQLYCAMD